MDKKIETRDKYKSKSLRFKVLNAVLWNVGTIFRKNSQILQGGVLLLSSDGYSDHRLKSLFQNENLRQRKN